MDVNSYESGVFTGQSPSAPAVGDSAAAAHRQAMAAAAARGTSKGDAQGAEAAPWRRAPSPAARSDGGAISPDSVSGTPEPPSRPGAGGGYEATTPAARAVPVPAQRPQYASGAGGAPDTYTRQLQWAAAKEAKLQAARREAIAAEEATVTGTPRLCAKSQAMVASARAHGHVAGTAATGAPSSQPTPSSGGGAGGGTHLDLESFLAAAASASAPPAPPSTASKAQQQAETAQRLYSDAEARLARAEKRAAELQAEEYLGTPAITRKAAALGPSRKDMPVGDRLHAQATAQQRRAAEAQAKAEEGPPPVPPSSARKRGSGHVSAEERLRAAMAAAHSEGGVVPPEAPPMHVKGGAPIPQQWRSVYATEEGVAEHDAEYMAGTNAGPGDSKPPPAPGVSLYARGLTRAQKRMMQAEHEAEEAKTIAAPKLNRNSLRMAAAREDSAIERLYFAPVAKAKAAKEAESKGGEGGLDNASVHSGATGSVAGLTADDEENCTFRPAISEHSRRMAGRRRGGDGPAPTAEERLMAEGRKRQERLAARKAEIEAEMLQECTFEPNTIPDVDDRSHDSPEGGGDTDGGPPRLKLAPATEAGGATSRPKRQVTSAQASAMYQRMQEWQNKKQERIDRLRAAAAAEGDEECTFQPFVQGGSRKAGGAQLLEGGFDGGGSSRGRGPIIQSYGTPGGPRQRRSRSSSPGSSQGGDGPTANKHTVAETKGFASFMARQSRARALAAEKSDAENALLLSRSRYAPDATLEYAKRTGRGEAWALGEGPDGGLSDSQQAESDAAAYAEALRAEDEGRGGAGGFKPMVAAQTVLGAEAATVVSRLTGMAGSVASGLRGVSGGVSASGANLPPLPDEIDARARALRMTHSALNGGSPSGVLPDGVSFHGDTDFRTSYATRHNNTVAVRDILVEAEKERNARSAQLQWAEEGGSSDEERSEGGGESQQEAPPLSAEEILAQADAALLHAAGLNEVGEGGLDTPSSSAPSARLASASRGVQSAAAAAARASGVAALGSGAAAELARREARDDAQRAEQERDAAAAASHSARSSSAGSGSDSDSDSGGSEGNLQKQRTAAESAIEQLLNDAATYTAHLDARRGRTEAAARELRLSPRHAVGSVGGVAFKDEAPSDLESKTPMPQAQHAPRRGGLKSSLKSTAASAPQHDGQGRQAAPKGFSALQRLAGGATAAPGESSTGVDALKSRIDALVARTSGNAR